MKALVISVVAMFMIMVFPFGGLFSSLIKSIVGGGVEQTYIYPIYVGIIALAGFIVVATDIILSEIEKLKELIEKNDKESKN